MSEEILIRLEHASFLIALFAVAVIVAGFVVSTVRYLAGIRELTPEKNFTRLKIELARALTLGLEILVVADVIETITVTPTFQSLSVLALLVVIRTVLSWTLSLQIEGHWPWQGSSEAEEHG